MQDQNQMDYSIGGLEPMENDLYPSSASGSYQVHRLPSGQYVSGGLGENYGYSGQATPTPILGAITSGGMAGSMGASGAGVMSLGAITSRKPCNCNKSNCLKLYCECFSQGQLCQNCNCSNCMNNLTYEQERSRAVKMILERNPLAFQPKIGRGEGERKHTKGCNCKRSGCLKNYCECYEAKISCTDLCRCQGCRNTEDSIDRRSLLRLQALELSRLKYGTSVTKHLVARSSDTLPHTFLTWEVIESVLHCLLSKATECDRRDLPPASQEKLIMSECGRCLNQVIDAANKAQPNSMNSGLSAVDAGDPLSGLLDSDNLLLGDVTNRNGRSVRHSGMRHSYHSGEDDLMEGGNAGDVLHV